MNPKWDWKWVGYKLHALMTLTYYVRASKYCSTDFVDDDETAVLIPGSSEKITESEISRSIATVPSPNIYKGDCTMF